jgi:hypothetical protein
MLHHDWEDEGWVVVGDAELLRVVWHLLRMCDILMRLYDIQ